jgi:hypothetical protein
MLIGSQVTASALLLVCAAVFLRSTYSSATAEVGLRTDDTLVVRRITEPARPAMIHAIKGHPSIASVAAAWPDPMRGGTAMVMAVGQTTLEVGCKLVSPSTSTCWGSTCSEDASLLPRSAAPPPAWS